MYHLIKKINVTPCGFNDYFIVQGEVAELVHAIS